MRKEPFYNPFYPHTKPLLQALLQAGHSWFVRQSFPRGLANESNPEVKQVFIVSHYNDLHQAEAHFSAVKAHDPWAFFYDVNDPALKKRLLNTAEPYLEYRFFSNTASPDWKLKLRNYEPMYRGYIEQVLGWTASGKETVYIKIYSQFGDVFATLKYKNEKVKLRLSDIEKYALKGSTQDTPLRLSWLQSISPE